MCAGMVLSKSEWTECTSLYWLDFRKRATMISGELDEGMVGLSDGNWMEYME